MKLVLIRQYLTKLIDFYSPLSWEQTFFCHNHDFDRSQKISNYSQQSYKKIQLILKRFYYCPNILYLGIFCAENFMLLRYVFLCKIISTSMYIQSFSKLIFEFFHYFLVWSICLWLLSKIRSADPNLQLVSTRTILVHFPTSAQSCILIKILSNVKFKILLLLELQTYKYSPVTICT